MTITIWGDLNLLVARERMSIFIYSPSKSKAPPIVVNKNKKKRSKPQCNLNYRILVCTFKSYISMTIIYYVEIWNIQILSHSGMYILNVTIRADVAIQSYTEDTSRSIQTRHRELHMVNNRVIEIEMRLQIFWCSTI